MAIVQQIISGGQTGADRGGLDAAADLGIKTGGWCPRGRRAEDGSVPERYAGLRETTSPGYTERTSRNVKESDGTIVFTRGQATPGSLMTIALAQRLGKPSLHIDLTTPKTVNRVAAWLRHERPTILNIAGSRESKAPGIAEEVRRVINEAVRAATIFDPNPEAPVPDDRGR